MSLFASVFAKTMKIRARLFLFDKPINCFAFLFTFCFYVYFSRSYESRNLGDKSLRLVPQIQTWFEFVGQVAGTKFWSLRLDFLVKMGSSHEGT